MNLKTRYLNFIDIIEKFDEVYVGNLKSLSTLRILPVRFKNAHKTLVLVALQIR